MPDPDEDVVAQALAAVIRDHGWRVTEVPARLRAGLSDVLGAGAEDHKGLLDALVVSAEEGTPAAVRRCGRDRAATIRTDQLTGLESWGLSAERAAWVLDTWIALVPDQTDTPPGTLGTPDTVPDTVRDDRVTVVPGGRLVAAPPETTRLPGGAPGALGATRLPGGDPPAPPRDPTALPPRAPDDPAAATTEDRPSRAVRNRLLAGIAALVLVAGSGLAVALARGDDKPAAASDGAAGSPSSSSTSTTSATTSATTSPTPEVAALAAGRVVPAPGARPARARERFAMAGAAGGVRIAALGPVDSIGRGDAARVAPQGATLVAFTLADWCPTTGCRPWPRIGPRVAIGKRVSTLPRGGPTYAVAVPSGVRADLVLRANGHEQRLSLADGSPGSGNITVLSRELAPTKIGRSADPVASTAPYSFDYGFGRLSSVRRHGVVTSARLGFFDGALTPANPRRALLYVEAYYDYSAYGSTGRYQFAADEVHLRAAGRAPVRPVAGPYANDDQNAAVYVFEVPGDFARGTFLIGGQSLARTTPSGTAGVPAGTPYRLNETVVGIPIEVR